jgi:hypothetical protein
MKPEYGHLAAPEFQYSGDFPASSLEIRESTPETSSLSTAPTAILSAASETAGRSARRQEDCRDSAGFWAKALVGAKRRRLGWRR